MLCQAVGADVRHCYADDVVASVSDDVWPVAGAAVG